MIKKIRLAVLGLGVSLISTGVFAGIIDTYSPAGVSPLVSTQNSYSYTHSYDLGGETIVSASLEIWVADDSLFGWFGDFEGFRYAPNEGGQFRAASDNALLDSFSSDISAGASWFSFFNPEPFSWKTLGSSDLGNWFSDLADGSFTVNVSGTDGDFYFKQSRLTIETEAQESSVPEPAPIFILGLGLLGMAGLRRYRKTS